MKIEGHKEKIRHLEKTMLKLDEKEDYELIVEGCMLISAHFINACLHKLGIVNESKDIKHNQLFSFLKDAPAFGESAEAIINNVKEIEDLRPSHVYGRGENGNTAKNAKECCEEIKKECRKILEDGK